MTTTYYGNNAIKKKIARYMVVPQRSNKGLMIEILIWRHINAI
jgi:hypothetical protein